MRNLSATSDPDSLSDHELLTRVAEGDAAMFAELYRRHAGAAWSAARAIVANHDDAADAVAEAFTKILRSVRNGRTEKIRHFRAYVLTAARNAAVDRRRSLEDAFDGMASALGERAADGPSPTEVVIDLTDESYVLRAYRALPERWQRVLWLTEVEGLRPADIADSLEMNANSVAQLTFRARAGLREQFLRAQFGDVDPACENVVDLLAELLAGTLDGDQAGDVRYHLQDCHHCDERYAEIARLATPPRRMRLVAPFLIMGEGMRWAGRTLRDSLSQSPLTASVAHRSAAAAVAALAATAGLVAIEAGRPQEAAGSERVTLPDTVPTTLTTLVEAWTGSAPASDSGSATTTTQPRRGPADDVLGGGHWSGIAGTVDSLVDSTLDTAATLLDALTGELDDLDPAEKLVGKAKAATVGRGGEQSASSRGDDPPRLGTALADLGRRPSDQRSSQSASESGDQDEPGSGKSSDSSRRGLRSSNNR